MQPNEPLFAATLATGSSFILYYLVRNALYARVFKKYPRDAGIFESIVLMVVILAPVFAAVPARGEAFARYYLIVAMYFVFVFVVFFINYLVVNKFSPPNRDPVPEPVEQIRYLMNRQELLVKDEAMILKLVKDIKGRYKYVLEPIPGSKPMPKELTVMANFYFFEET